MNDKEKEVAKVGEVEIEPLSDEDLETASGGSSSSSSCCSNFAANCACPIAIAPSDI